MKNIKYIFIIIMLVGLFIPTIKINAQTSPLGECTVVEVGKNPIKETTTEADCKKKNISGVAASRWASIPSNYYLLAPLPCEKGTEGCVDGQLKSFDPAQKNNLSSYLNLMIRIFIGICAVLAMVMIVTGGLEYMTSELAHSKEAGKEKIIHAILGLVIALGAYVLLFTINPDLLKGEPKIDNTTVTVPIKPALQSAPLGTCEYYAGENNTDMTVDITTEVACHKLGNFISWIKNP